MTSKDAKQVLREMIPTIAHYDREVRQQIALRMRSRHLMRQKNKRKLRDTCCGSRRRSKM